MDWNKESLCFFLGLETGHTLRGCVDWNLSFVVCSSWWLGHTLRGCVDWNLSSWYSLDWSNKSHPAWVCGLKHSYSDSVHVFDQSHPAWVCGLKLIMWIIGMVNHSHTLRGCVDWNILASVKVFLIIVTPCVGVWIETMRRWRCTTFPPVTPCVGVWIETSPPLPTSPIWHVTPCVGVWIETYLFCFELFFYKSHPAWVCGLKHEGIDTG